MEVDGGDLALAELASELELQGGAEAFDLGLLSESSSASPSSPGSSSPQHFASVQSTSPWAGADGTALQLSSSTNELMLSSSSGDIAPPPSQTTQDAGQQSPDGSVSFGTEVAMLGASPPRKKRQRQESGKEEMVFMSRTLQHAATLAVMGHDGQLHPVTIHFDPHFSGLCKAPPEVREEGATIHNKRNFFHLTYEFRLYDEVANALINASPGSRQYFATINGNFVPLVGFRADVGAVAVVGSDWASPRDVPLQHRPKRGSAATQVEPLPLLPGVDAKHDRILFGESTSRKGGRASEYFFVVVDLVGTTAEGEPIVLQKKSTTPIIVLSANPGSYRTANVNKWVKSGKDVLSTSSKVGIGTRVPEASLSVAGDVAITGTMYRPSDRRIKSKFEAVDKESQLDSIRKLQLYDYEKKDPGTGKVVQERGVIAQELREIIPDSVKEVKMITSDGQHIDDFNIVDERRLMIETIGATQALDEGVRDLDSRVSTIEQEESGLGGGGGGGGNASEILAVGAVTQGSLLPWVILLAFLVTILALVIVGGVVLVAVVSQSGRDPTMPQADYPPGIPSASPTPFRTNARATLTASMSPSVSLSNTISSSSTMSATPSPSITPSPSPTPSTSPTASPSWSASPSASQASGRPPTSGTNCPPGSFFNYDTQICAGCGSNNSCADCPCGAAGIIGGPCLGCPPNTYSPEGPFSCLPCHGNCQTC